jgi:hypothetical protein
MHNPRPLFPNTGGLTAERSPSSRALRDDSSRAAALSPRAPAAEGIRRGRMPDFLPDREIRDADWKIARNTATSSTAASRSPVPPIARW